MLDGRDRAVVHHADLQFGHHPLTLVGVVELLLPRETELHRVSFDGRGHGGPDDLHGDARLTAKPTTDVRGDHPDVLVLEPERGEGLGEQMALGVRRLRGSPHRQSTRMVELAHRDVGLDGAMGVARHPVRVFEDEVRPGKSLIGIALADLPPVGDVRVRLREEPRHVGVLGQIRMDKSGI